MADEREIPRDWIEHVLRNPFLRSPIRAIPERFELMRRSRSSVIACFELFIMIGGAKFA